jgi:hypothetical protein
MKMQHSAGRLLLEGQTSICALTAGHTSILQHSKQHSAAGVWGPCYNCNSRVCPCAVVTLQVNIHIGADDAALLCEKYRHEDYPELTNYVAFRWATCPVRRTAQHTSTQLGMRSDLVYVPTSHHSSRCLRTSSARRLATCWQPNATCMWRQLTVQSEQISEW